jgi:hypothetical protein
MSKKHEIKQQLAKLSDEIELMAGKSEDEGFKQDIYDAMKEKFIDINKQLGRVEEAEKIAATSPPRSRPGSPDAVRSSERAQALRHDQELPRP